MMLSITLILFLLGVIISYVYIKRKYFTLRRSLPGMSPHFLLGNVLQTRCLKGESYINVQAKLKALYGDIYQYWLGPYHYYVFNKADHAEHVFTHKAIYDLPTLTFGLQFPLGLVSIRGADYRRHARLILPMFKKVHIVHHFDVIIACTDRWIGQWRDQIGIENSLLNTNIAEESKSLLLDIISLVAFDYDLNDHRTQKYGIHRQELIEALNTFTQMYDILVRSTGIPTFMMKLYMQWNRNYQNALEKLEHYANAVIEQAREELQRSNTQEVRQKPRSVIKRLVAAWLQYDEHQRNDAKPTHEGLSREELFDEILVLILAGFATTSSALAWFIHYMSKYPTVQVKIKDELKEQNIHRETYLTIDSLSKLTYLDCVLKELLRFAPIVNSARRTLTQDDVLDGVELKKGDSVLIPLYNLHMDHRYWHLNPQEFIPERFIGEDQCHHPYALLTFGGGHRQCIGQELARLELKIMMARLMQCVTFIDGGNAMNSGGHRQSLTNSPKTIGVFIRLDPTRGF